MGRHAKLPESSSPAYFLAQAAMLSAGVPGGVTLLEGCLDRSAIVVHPHGNTLREILDGITQDDSSYVWNVKTGVINLVPSAGVPALLNTHLAAYDSGDLTNVITAVTLLASSEEISEAASHLGLQKNMSGDALGGVGPGPPQPKKRLNIHLQNATLLEVLNALAKANNHGVWTYSEKHCAAVNQFDLTFTE